MRMRDKLLRGYLGGATVKTIGELIAEKAVAYWKLTEVSDGSAPVTRADSKGVSHLTDVNNTVGGATGANFEVDLSQRMYCNDNAALSLGDVDFAFDGWVTFETLGNNYIISKGSSTTSPALYSFLILMKASAGNKLVFTLSNGTSAGAIQSTAGLATTKYYIYVYHDSVNNKLGMEINGVAVAPVDYSGGGYDDAQRFYFGTSPGNEIFMDGLLADWAMYKTLLTADERTWRYNAGAGNPLPL